MGWSSSLRKRSKSISCFNELKLRFSFFDDERVVFGVIAYFIPIMQYTHCFELVGNIFLSFKTLLVVAAISVSLLHSILQHCGCVDHWMWTLSVIHHD